MGNVYVRDADDFRTADAKNLEDYVEQRRRKLAVIFPGVGYHTDKPLLYYSKKLASAFGYTIREVRYPKLPSGIKGNKDKMMEAFETASEYVTKQLSDVDFSLWADVLFISKSIGTAVAAAYALRHSIPARQIYYTPVEEYFLAIGSEGIAFHGTADSWARTEVIEEECRKRGLPLYETAGANHSLETGNVREDLKNLAEIMRRTEEYIRI